MGIRLGFLDVLKIIIKHKILRLNFCVSFGILFQHSFFLSDHVFMSIQGFVNLWSSLIFISLICAYCFYCSGLSRETAAATKPEKVGSSFHISYFARRKFTL